MAGPGAPKPGPKPIAIAAALVGALALGLGGGAVARDFLRSADAGAVVSTVLSPADRAVQSIADRQKAAAQASPEAAAQQAAAQQAAAGAKHAPCASNKAAQLVKVSLAEQRLWLCAGAKLAYESPVTTGKARPDTKTPTGSFKVQARYRNVVLTPDSGARVPVDYWIPFLGPNYGFHDSAWQKVPYGEPKATRTGGSQGCVHLPAAAMAYLYAWAHVGASVRIT